MKTRFARSMCDTTRHRVSPFDTGGGELCSRTGREHASAGAGATGVSLAAVAEKRTLCRRWSAMPLRAAAAAAATSASSDVERATDQRHPSQPLAGKQECIKSVNEMNRETAQYCHLAVALGCRSDSEAFRRQLGGCRKRVCDLARGNMAKLLPHVRGAGHKDTTDEYDKLWITFISCLELLQRQLLKTLLLIKAFPLNSRQINTGVAESAFRLRSMITNRGDPFSGTIRNKSFIEDDIKSLQREIRDIYSILQEMHSTVDVKPWTIEPDLNQYVSRSIASACSNEPSLQEELSSSSHTSPRRKRKSACIVAIILFSVLLCVLLTAICIALLT